MVPTTDSTASQNRWYQLQTVPPHKIKWHQGQTIPHSKNQILPRADNNTHTESDGTNNRYYHLTESAGTKDRQYHPHIIRFHQTQTKTTLTESNFTNNRQYHTHRIWWHWGQMKSVYEIQLFPWAQKNWEDMTLPGTLQADHLVTDVPLDCSTVKSIQNILALTILIQ